MKFASRMISILLALLSVCALLSGCFTGCGPHGREINEIMKLPSHKRPEALSRMPPERQLALFFYGQKYEPPLNLQYYIAANWRSLLPVVKQHLAAESDDKRLADMVALLRAISVTQCSLEERKDVLDLASQAVGKLRNNTYRQNAIESLSMVTHPTKPLPPCNP